MSRKSSLREELERRVAETAKGPVASDSSAANRVLLLPTDSIDQPVEFVRLLSNHGLSLRKGRETLESLASGQIVVVDLITTDLAGALSGLAGFGVVGTEFEVPNVDVRRVREKQHLSQPDFAKCYGLEVDTVRNWEQGRYGPDGPAKVLLNVIDHEPDAVIRSLLDRRFTRSWLTTWTEHTCVVCGEHVVGASKPASPPPEGFVWVLKPKHAHTE